MSATETISRRGFFNKFTPLIEDQSTTFRPLSISANLAPYSPSSAKPWNRQRAAHLLRRTGMGAHKEAVDQLLSQDPVAAVNQLIDEAIAEPLPPRPPWADQPIDKAANNSQKFETQIHWFDQMRITSFRERMAFFWSNHLVAASSGYKQAVYMYEYLTLLRTHALGNFQSFVYDIGLSAAMLHFLDGIKNKDSGPNENYARELCELFTMGIFNEFGEPNYVQNDIAEMARALTGIRYDDNALTAYVEDKLFDKGVKSFFGHTGNFGYDDVVSIIFQERPSAIAHHVSEQIYKYFVHAVPNQDVVSAMASIFLANNFEIAPVMRALFSSEHFFEEAIIGARFKGPIELLNGLINDTGMTVQGEAINELFDDLKRLGQELFDPPNVAGWPGYHTWMSTGSLPIRWENMTKMINGGEGYTSLNLVPLAQQMPDPNNPSQLTRDLADYFLPQPLSESDYDILTQVLLDGIPDYEWDISEQGTGERLRGFLSFLVQLPEYQLT